MDSTTLKQIFLGKFMQAVYAVVLSMWASMGSLMQGLIVLIFIDVGTGIASGYVTRALDSEVSFRGMVRKSLMLVLAYLGHFMTSHWSLGFDMGATIAGFFCLNELISIVENCGRAKVPIPYVLGRSINKIKTIYEVDDQGEAPKGAKVTLIENQQKVKVTTMDAPADPKQRDVFS